MKNESAVAGEQAVPTSEREAFEAWCETVGLNTARNSGKGVYNYYHLDDTAHAWIAWLARAAHQAAQGAAQPPLPEVALAAPKHDCEFRFNPLAGKCDMCEMFAAGYMAGSAQPQHPVTDDNGKAQPLRREGEYETGRGAAPDRREAVALRYKSVKGLLTAYGMTHNNTEALMKNDDFLSWLIATHKPESETVALLKGALEAIVDFGKDRQKFMMLGARAFIAIESIAATALAEYAATASTETPLCPSCRHDETVYHCEHCGESWGIPDATPALAP